jgi:hypothetical protein
MLYAILCYNFEDVVGAWTPGGGRRCHGAAGGGRGWPGRQGGWAPARLLPTTAAVTLRKGRESLVVDGPFAETKEQLLGFYVVECEGLEAAIEVARDLAAANPDRGAYEIRPLAVYRPGEPDRARATLRHAKGAGA